MTVKMDDALLRAATETLENLAFMEVFPARGEVTEVQSEMTASLLFHEPCQGEIRIATPPALLEKISQTVFGIQAEGMTIPDSRDLLAEILNTIAGRFLIEWLPADQPFRLGLPELDPPPICETDIWTHWIFRADDHLFTISITNLFNSQFTANRA